MTNTTPVYSTLFHCLYDQEFAPSTHFPRYSIFRAVDSRDVTQQPVARPRVHDFAVIWDEDDDTRIIAVIEEMLMEGLLPGVQFIGEHKGMLTIILAARTYWQLDNDAYIEKVSNLTAAAGDSWSIELGMFDHSRGNLSNLHQCEFRNLVGGSDGDIAFMFMLDSAWNLGTKEWDSVGTAPVHRVAPGNFFNPSSRYLIQPDRKRNLAPPPFLNQLPQVHIPQPSAPPAHPAQPLPKAPVVAPVLNKQR